MRERQMSAGSAGGSRGACSAEAGTSPLRVASLESGSLLRRLGAESARLARSTASTQGKPHVRKARMHIRRHARRARARLFSLTQIAHDAMSARTQPRSRQAALGAAYGTRHEVRGGYMPDSRRAAPPPGRLWSRVAGAGTRLRFAEQPRQRAFDALHHGAGRGVSGARRPFEPRFDAAFDQPAH